MCSFLSWVLDIVQIEEVHVFLGAFSLGDFGSSAREGVPGRQQEQEKFAFQHFAYVKLGVCQSIMQMSSVALQTFCGLPHLAHAAVVVSALS